MIQRRKLRVPRRTSKSAPKVRVHIGVLPPLGQMAYTYASEATLGGSAGSTSATSAGILPKGSTRSSTGRNGRLLLPNRSIGRSPPIRVDWPAYKFKSGLEQRTAFDAAPTSTSHPAVQGSLLQTWGVTSNFNAAKKAGTLQPQPFVRRERVYVMPSGSFNYYPVGRPDQYHQVSGSFVDGYVDWYSNGVSLGLTIDGHAILKDAMSNALLSKAKDMKVNLAQTFAERQQTMNMIGSTARNLADAFKSLRRKDVPGFWNALGLTNRPAARVSQAEFKRLQKQKASMDPFTFASNKWVEYKYGWSPLVGDLWNSLELLKKTYKRRRKVTTSKQITGKNDFVQLAGLGNALVLNTSDQTVFQGKGSCIFHIGYAEPSALSSFGLTNPVELAWELLPYSFVVDWFFDVGGYLTTWDATLGLNFEIGIWSSKCVYARSIYAAGSTSSGPLGTWTYEGYGTSVDRWITHIREPFATWPSSVLPELKNPLSLDHMLTGLALLRQAFRR